MNKSIILLFTLLSFIVYDANAQEPLVRNYSVNLENDAVRKYMEEVVYFPHKESVIDDYRKKLESREDWPNPVVMDIPETDADTLLIVCCDDETLEDSLKFQVTTDNSTVELYNFIPNRTYRYQIKDEDTILQEGKIVTKGQLRMINVCNTVMNVRDLGGWKTIDDQQICYGKIFRGSELNGTHIATEEGIQILLDLGVEAELDMRAWYNKGNNTSAYGFSSTSLSGGVANYFYTYDSGQLPSHMTNSIWQSKWRSEFMFIVNNLHKEHAVYEHCVSGKDRVGFLSFLLEGLLGVPYNELAKDYELSFFSFNIESTKDSIDKVFDYIESLEGETIRDKFNTYFVNKLNVSQTDIDYFRSVMLEAVRPEVDDNDIITAISNVTHKVNRTADSSVYDLNGRRVNSVGKGGIYLVRSDNGTTRKVIIPSGYESDISTLPSSR